MFVLSTKNDEIARHMSESKEHEVRFYSFKIVLVSFVEILALPQSPGFGL